jgi:hypothetical protein
LLSALREAVNVMKKRSFINDITSVFLLTDGRDNSRENFEISHLDFYMTKHGFGRFQANTKPFTINCFGYGDDHDSTLLRQISNYKDGCFYYIENLPLVRKCFLDALGGLVSVICEQAFISVDVQYKKENFQSVIISKTYGNKWNLPEESKKAYGEINLNHVLSGVKKDFVFKLEITPQEPLQEGEIVVTARFKAKSLFESKGYITKESTAKVQGVIQPISETPAKDSDVSIQKLRVEAAEAIEAAIDLSDKNKFDEGSQAIKKAIEDIDKFDATDEEADKTKKKIKKHLLKCNQVTGKANFTANGRNQMNEIQAIQMNQNSSVSLEGYSNEIQTNYQKY